VAVPVTGQRGATTPGALAEPTNQRAPAGEVRPLHRGRLRPTTLIVLLLLLAALVSRIYTTNSLAGEPTSDEYLYAVNARDLARAWLAGQAMALSDLTVEGRSVAVEAAALSFILPWDPLTVGRTLQALLNALCIPMTFVLGRRIGLPRMAAVSAALLLMAVPEFQELSWRFWTDSQATLVCMIYLSALASFARRPSVVAGGLALAGLSLLVLTKESAAITFTPFLAIAAAIPLSRRWSGSLRASLSVAGVVLALALVGLVALLTLAPSELVRSPLLEKSFGAGPLILRSVRDSVPRLPAYSQQLTLIFGPRELGSGVLWAILVGYAWLLGQTGVALATVAPRWNLWVLGWLMAAVAWAPAVATPARDLSLLGQADPYVAVAATGLLAIIGAVGGYLRGSRVQGWGLTLVAMVILAVLSERLVISVTPQVASAALTFRSLMPIVPLFALLGGGGIWAAAGALALLVPTSLSARAALTFVTTVLLVVFWTPLLRERLSPDPLLGRVADRGADVSKAEGLRQELLVEAQDWLKANLSPRDVIIVAPGLARQLTWYADLGVDGMARLIDLNSQPRTEEQKRQYILDRVGPTGAEYVVDFNVSWTDPTSDGARQWRQTYEALAGRPSLEIVYLSRDRFGYPVFYVLRNHGYAARPPDAMPAGF
jgi:Dolichyl-phosphate-mannose-protein mannosyltransferase